MIIYPLVRRVNSYNFTQYYDDVLKGHKLAKADATWSN